METAITIIFQLIILIFSVVIHEVSHGLAANALGDPTAKYAGRLTLDPLKHLDPVGSFIVPLASFLLGGFIVGWAKPVPYNPYNLKVKNQDFGSAIVGVAGPAANIAIALVFGFLIRGAGYWSKVLGAGSTPLLEVMAYIVLINIVLAIFNLMPIPPLDGSKVLFALLPERWIGLRLFLERFGFALLLLFIFYLSGSVLPGIVGPIFRFFTGLGF
ncbi:MAG: site-2 protease family protein [Candidatus Sungbacteria bacterium]|nr:site-2 protease family protein [Candidatus Sungbacteria bacterium]